MLLILNFLFGAGAVIMMALVLYGQLGDTIPKHEDGKIKSRHELTPGDFMRLGIVFYHVKGLLRIALWDVLFLMMNWERTWWGSCLNIFFCSLAIAGSLSILKALHLSIPEKDRDKYNIFTAPWYPDLPPLRMNWFL